MLSFAAATEPPRSTSNSPSRRPTLIPSNKMNMLVPPPLEPTHYRIPRLLGGGGEQPDGTANADARSRDLQRAQSATPGGGGKRVRIVEAGEEGHHGAHQYHDDPTHNYSSIHFASPSSSALRRGSGFDGSSPAPSSAHAPPSSSRIGVRSGSGATPQQLMRDTRGEGSPAHMWGRELDALMRCRDTMPEMEEFHGEGVHHQQHSADLWAQHDDGTDVWSPHDPYRRATRRRSSPNYRRPKRQNAFEWIMSARQHEVLSHNGVKWKSPSEAYGAITRPAMYRIDARDNGTPTTPGGRDRSKLNITKQRAELKRMIPPEVTGIERMRLLSTDNIYDDRRNSAMLQEKRRHNASLVMAQMQSLSPRRREASAITEQEQPRAFSESARWYQSGTAVVLGTPRPEFKGNGLPGPGYYETPKTFGAGYPP